VSTGAHRGSDGNRGCGVRSAIIVRLALALIIPLAAAPACSSPSGPSHAQPAVNQQQIITRVARDIGPP
jgi:hypothetical protein